MNPINKFCFVAIVKNESKIIKRCIDSICNIATSYLICDTGSIDQTPEIIQDYMIEKEIPGKVIHCEWKNYGYNKSYLMDQAYTHNGAMNAKYIIWHDADEVFIKNPDDYTSYLEKSDAEELYNWLETRSESIFYIKTINGNCHYKRWNIVRNNQLYEWKSPKHEWLKGTLDNTSCFYDKFVLLARKEGNASKNPLRCQQDAQLYVDYINENGGYEKCGREVFYLAQEYESFDREKSMKYYEIKINLSNQWIQETYISYLRLGRLSTDPYYKLKYWKAGFKILPIRLECLHEIVKYYMEIKKFTLALKWAILASENRTIDPEYLFTEADIYDSLFDLDYSITAYYSEKYQLANYVNQKNIQRNFGKEIIHRLESNQKFINEKLPLESAIVNYSIKSRSNDLRPNLIIVDNFYLNPDQIRNLALNEKYDIVGNYPGGRTKSFASEKIKNRFENIIGKKITYWPDGYNGAFQLTNANNKSWIHRDNTDYAAIIFLTPNAPTDSGTILYRHKVTGLRSTTNQIEEKTLNSDSNNDEAWEKVDIIGNIYNRCILFNGKNSHKSNVYFGNTKENSRLFQTFFFNTEM